MKIILYYQGVHLSLTINLHHLHGVGFWTRGQYSDNLKSPYLDRFRRFPHMSFGFGLTRVIDDKKSWSFESPGPQTRDYTFKNRDAYYQPVMKN